MTKKERESYYKSIQDTITLCAKLGVSRFEWEGMKIEFGANSTTLGLIHTEPETKTTGKPGLPPTVEYPPESIDMGLVQDFRRAQTMLDDPLAYEEEIMREQLESGGISGGH